MRNKDDFKEKSIREKAIEIIVKEGFDGLSMHKLAKAVDISASTIYIYFKNKSDLLNRLFNYVQKQFTEIIFDAFSSNLAFEEGLWLLWQNHLKFIIGFPMHFKFLDQFRNSYLINHDQIETSTFDETIRNFAKSANKKGEIAKMEPEIFWPVCFGPLYLWVKLHQDKIDLHDPQVKQIFMTVIKASKSK